MILVPVSPAASKALRKDTTYSTVPQERSFHILRMEKVN